MDSKFTFSEYQKKKVHTWYVHDPRTKQKGLLTSITEAIGKADPYDRIELMGGTFFENILITKPIELVGTEGEEPIINARGPAVHIACTSGRVVLSKVKIEAKGKKEAECVGLLIVNGNPLISGCTLTSVHVAGTANPKIELCNIVGSQGVAGVYISDSAGGELLQNEIFYHAGPCICAWSTGRVSFEDTMVYQMEKGKEHVVSVRGANVSFLNCRFSGEGSPLERSSPMKSSEEAAAAKPAGLNYGSEFEVFRAVILVDRGGNAVIQACSLTYGDVGVAVRYDGSVEMTQCDVRFMDIAGICGSAEMRLSKMTDVTIDRCKSFGIVAFKNEAEMIFERCAITSNRGVGVYGRDGKLSLLNSLVSHSTFHGLVVQGVSVIRVQTTDFAKNVDSHVTVKGFQSKIVLSGSMFAESKHGVVTKNCSSHMIVCGNTFNGCGHSVWMEGPGSPHITENKFLMCTQSHVTGTKASQGIVFNNSFEGNVGDHIVISVGSNLEVHHNKFSSRGLMTAVKVTDGGGGRIHHNDVSHTRIGFEVEKWGDPLIYDNEVRECRHCCVYVGNEGTGTIIGNTFVEGGAACVIVETGGEPTFRKNIIGDSISCGVLAQDGANGLFEKNTFRGSKTDFTLTGAHVQSSVLKNEFRGGSEVGILLTKNSCGIVRGNVFTGSKSVAIRATLGNKSLVSHNHIYNQGGYGVYVSDGALTEFESNRIEQCNIAGVACQSGCNATFMKDMITRNRKHGVEIGSKAGSRFIQCKISDNTEHGACVTGSSSATLKECLFEHNDLFGVAIMESGAADVDSCTIKQNKAGGCLFRSSGFAVVHDSNISNHEHNVVFRQNGLAKLAHNMLLDAAKSHALFEENGSGILEQNTMESSELHGCWFRDSASGKVVANVITECKQSAIFVEKSAHPEVERNTMTRCLYGIHVISTGKGRYVGNCCDNAGVRVEAKAEPHVEELVVCDAILEEGSQRTHAVVWEGGGALVTSTIKNNKCSGLLITSRQVVLFSEISVKYNSGEGMTFRACSSVCVAKNCSANENTLSGIVLEGGAEPTLQKCSADRNSEHGICARGSSQGSLVQCSTRKNRASNVRLEGNCYPFIDGLVSEECDGDSLVVHEGSGVLINSTFTNNGRAVCIEATKQNARHPTFTKCTFSENQIGVFAMNGSCEVKQCKFDKNSQGIQVMFNGLLKCVNTEFKENALGLSLFSGGVLSLSYCLLENNETGIRLTEDAVADISNNSFFHNTKYGMLISGGDQSNVTTKSNTFSFSGEAGVKVDGEHTFITLEGNTFENEGTGISSVGRTQCEVAHNYFTICDIGVYATDLTCIKIRENKFSQNKVGVNCSVDVHPESVVVRNTFESHTVHAIKVDTFCTVTITSNFILRNVGENGAIGLHTGARPHITKCIIEENFVGIWADDQCKPLIELNKIHRNASHAIVMENNSSGTISSNEIGENGDADIKVLSRSDPIITHNSFEATKVCNLLFSDYSVGEIMSNRFKGVEQAACIRVEDNATPKIARNAFEDVKVGILCCNEGSGLFTTNTFSNVIQAGYVCGARGRGDFQYNCVYQSKFAAVVLDNDSEGSISFNRLLCGGHGRMGIHMKSNSITEVHNNIVQTCPTGMVWDQGTTVHAHSNAVMSCRTGVVLGTGAKGWFEKNEVLENDIGIVVHQDNETKVTFNRVYNNKRLGIIVGSNLSDISENLFAAFDESAVETRPGATAPHKNNRVRHKFTPDVQKIPQGVPEFAHLHDELSLSDIIGLGDVQTVLQDVAQLADFVEQKMAPTTNITDYLALGEEVAVGANTVESIGVDLQLLANRRRKSHEWSTAETVPKSHAARAAPKNSRRRSSLWKKVEEKLVPGAAANNQKQASQQGSRAPSVSRKDSTGSTGSEAPRPKPGRRRSVSNTEHNSNSANLSRPGSRRSSKASMSRRGSTVRKRRGPEDSTDSEIDRNELAKITGSSSAKVAILEEPFGAFVEEATTLGLPDDYATNDPSKTTPRQSFRNKPPALDAQQVFDDAHLLNPGPPSRVGSARLAGRSVSPGANPYPTSLVTMVFDEEHYSGGAVHSTPPSHTISPTSKSQLLNAALQHTSEIEKIASSLRKFSLNGMGQWVPVLDDASSPKFPSMSKITATGGGANPVSPSSSMSPQRHSHGLLLSQSHMILPALVSPKSKANSKPKVEQRAFVQQTLPQYHHASILNESMHVITYKLIPQNPIGTSPPKDAKPTATINTAASPRKPSPQRHPTVTVASPSPPRTPQVIVPTTSQDSFVSWSPKHTVFTPPPQPHPKHPSITVDTTSAGNSPVVAGKQERKFTIPIVSLHPKAPAAPPTVSEHSSSLDTPQPRLHPHPPSPPPLMISTVHHPKRSSLGKRLSETQRPSLILNTPPLIAQPHTPLPSKSPKEFVLEGSNALRIEEESSLADGLMNKRRSLNSTINSTEIRDKDVLGINNTTKRRKPWTAPKDPRKPQPPPLRGFVLDILNPEGTSPYLHHAPVVRNSLKFVTKSETQDRIVKYGIEALW
eukprot:PhF_6_TR17061/c0_g1_i1/m.26076